MTGILNDSPMTHLSPVATGQASFLYKIPNFRKLLIPKRSGSAMSNIASPISVSGGPRIMQGGNQAASLMMWN